MASARPSRQNDVRLQKYLASCGLGSRRACERLIGQGNVCVDGQRVSLQGVTIDPEKSRVTVNGKRVCPERLCYLLLNKPRSYLCTANDPEGRDTFHALLPGDLPRVFSVGRLDYDSEGLLLVTNDGEWANRVLHPRHAVVKVYRVWTDRALSAAELRAAKQGVTVDGERLAVQSIRLKSRDGHRALYEIHLQEGRNRHIRRLLAAFEVRAMRLQRIRVGPLTLGNLKPGSYRRLTSDEVVALARHA